MTAAVRWPAGVDGSFFVVGAGGWLYWHVPDLPDCRVHVSLLGNEGPVVSALWLAAPADSQVRASALRHLPLGTLEAILRNPKIEECIRSTHEPDLAPTGWTSDPAIETWAAGLPTASSDDRARSLVIPQTIRRMKPAFYFVVQAIYSLQAQRSRHPARDIAEQNGVKEGTVHRWLWEARRYRKEMPIKIEKPGDAMPAIPDDFLTNATAAEQFMESLRYEVHLNLPDDQASYHD